MTALEVIRRARLHVRTTSGAAAWWGLPLAAVVPLALSACGGRVVSAPVADIVTIDPSARRAPLPASRAPAIVTPPRLDGSRGDGVAAHARSSPYAGSWTGTTARTSCSELGGAIGIACRHLPDRQRFHLRLAEQGAGLAGVLTLGGVAMPVSGRATLDGALTLRGRHAGRAHSIAIGGWRTRGGGGDMHGAFWYVIAPSDERLGRVTVTAGIDAAAIAR